MARGDAATRIFAALAEPRRRKILRYFISGETVSATEEELVEVLLASDGSPDSRATAELQLRHADLPALQRCKLVEHDERSETVRYLESPLVERNLDGAWTPLVRE